jgi:hypothetical protein
MLYPLSYEGLRPISYRPADIHECPGAPQGAKRCHRVASGGSRAGRRMRGANSAHTRRCLAGGDRGCPTVISGATHSPSNFGAR